MVPFERRGSPASRKSEHVLKSPGREVDKVREPTPAPKEFSREGRGKHVEEAVLPRKNSLEEK
jgi:hypothetical protein